MTKKLLLLLGILVLALVWAISTAASGDSSADPKQCAWNIGDPYKMHFPQLPDIAAYYGGNTWSVNATADIVLADDFLCTETGFITDVHFWGSWKDDIPGDILFFTLSIHDDIPADQSPYGYSMPGETLWEMEVSIACVHIVPLQTEGAGGWYDPSTGEVIAGNHTWYYQYNICLDEFLDMQDIFYQEEGTIYWLNITAVVADPVTTQWGWENSSEHWTDDAVWRYLLGPDWQEIHEPGFNYAEHTFYVEFGEDGTPIDAGGTNYYDDGTSFNGWFYYPNTDWWNIWFYDHPFEPNGYKLYDIYFEWYPTDPYYWIEVAANWATPDWPPGNPPPVPPLTPAEENLYIEREYLELYPPGLQQFGVLIPDYCPEWVSMDFMGQNFIIEGGYTIHECVTDDTLSLDLAFVITGRPCDVIIGDADDSDSWDIDDVVYLVAYIFIGGPPPTPYEKASGDATCDCQVDIDDVVHLINYIFVEGPPPCACEEWMSYCGSLR
jgi:hypothetical protein